MKEFSNLKEEICAFEGEKIFEIIREGTTYAD